MYYVIHFHHTDNERYFTTMRGLHMEQMRDHMYSSSWRVTDECT